MDGEGARGAQAGVSPPVANALIDDRPAFTHEAPPPGIRVILNAIVGSSVHGTAVDGQDDLDLMSIVVEPIDYVVGLKRWDTSVIRTQPEGVRSGPGDIDIVMHSLRKYAALAANGNPTILLPLFVSGKHVRTITRYGHMLQAQRGMFLSRRAGIAFLHYMRQQRGKLEGTRGGRHGSRPELEEAFGFDTKYAGHIIRLGMQGIELMTDHNISLPMQPAMAKAVIEVRTGKWTLERVLRIANELERALEAQIPKSSLPDTPNIEQINSFVCQTYLSAWGEPPP